MKKSGNHQVMMVPGIPRCDDQSATRLTSPDKTAGGSYWYGMTRMCAIMPPSSCSRMWQWYTKSPTSENGMLTYTDFTWHAPERHVAIDPSQASEPCGTGMLSTSAPGA